VDGSFARCVQYLSGGNTISVVPILIKSFSSRSCGELNGWSSEWMEHSMDGALNGWSSDWMKKRMGGDVNEWSS
jgi:hypothetical protein